MILPFLYDKFKEDQKYGNQTFKGRQEQGTDVP